MTCMQQNREEASSEQASSKPKYEDAVKRQMNCCQAHSAVSSTPPQLYTVTFNEYDTYSRHHSPPAYCTSCFS